MSSKFAPKIYDGPESIKAECLRAVVITLPGGEPALVVPKHYKDKVPNDGFYDYQCHVKLVDGRYYLRSQWYEIPESFKLVGHISGGMWTGVGKNGFASVWEDENDGYILLTSPIEILLTEHQGRYGDNTIPRRNE